MSKKNADYYRDYYARTAPRRRQLARERKCRLYWAKWLVSELRGVWHSRGMEEWR